MQLIGKKGNYTYFKHKGPLVLLEATLPIQPDHIIAGGTPVEMLLAKGRRLKDIDIWVSGDIPKEATQESEFAWNYRKSRSYPLVQYIKVRAHKPSALLDTFDLDAAKCAFYNITPEGYDVCIHNWLKPIVYGKEPQGTCGVNPEAFNQFTLGRLTKYAKRFAKGMEMFTPADFALACSQLQGLERVPMETLLDEVGKYQAGNDTGGYELLAHLQDLFGTHRGFSTGGLTDAGRAYQDFLINATSRVQGRPRSFAREYVADFLTGYDQVNSVDVVVPTPPTIGFRSVADIWHTVQTRVQTGD